MRHQHQRGAVFAVHLEQQADDGGARIGIEAAGRLVGEEELGPHHERARERHALLLAAGKVLGIVVQPLRQADAAEHVPGKRVGVAAS